MANSVQDRDWWERTWKEREDTLIEVFGESQPPGSPPRHVISLNMAFPEDWPSVAIPGACVQVFPPNPSPSRNEIAREFWLYVTTGLSQPRARGSAWNGVGLARDDKNAGTLSAYGAELGIMLDGADNWAPGFLRTLMGYVTAEAPIRGGHRIPFAFHRVPNRALSWVLGDPTEPCKTRADETAAMLFWPMLFGPGLFTTSTGSFDLLIGTSITSAEWDLAKQTSTAHVLLLLCRAGIGQRTIAGRESLTRDRRWLKEWERISTMTYDDITSELQRIGNEHLPKWRGRRNLTSR